MDIFVVKEESLMEFFGVEKNNRDRHEPKSFLTKSMFIAKRSDLSIGQVVRFLVKSYLQLLNAEIDVEVNYIVNKHDDVSLELRFVEMKMTPHVAN